MHLRRTGHRYRSQIARVLVILVKDQTRLPFLGIHRGTGCAHSVPRSAGIPRALRILLELKSLGAGGPTFSDDSACESGWLTTCTSPAILTPSEPQPAAEACSSLPRSARRSAPQRSSSRREKEVAATFTVAFNSR